VEGGYQYPKTVPTNPAEKKAYENNAKAVNALLEVYQNQNFSNSCSSTQPKKCGTKSFIATKETPK